LRPVFTVAVGVQDGSFEAFQRGVAEAVQYTSLCLTKIDGPIIQDIKLDCITVDGTDSTEVLLNNLAGWDYEVLILGGATFAGFNVIDVKHVYRETMNPVIVFSSKKPDMKSTRGALRKHFPDWRKRWQMYMKLGELYEIIIDDKPVYYEVIGETPEFAERILREQALNGHTPEAIRVADLIAKGVTPIFPNPTVSHCGS